MARVTILQVPEQFKKGGSWIQGAVNPSHKGFCTPMTKSTCTGKRRAFALTMKKHHGFHQAGGDISIPNLDNHMFQWGGPQDKNAWIQNAGSIINTQSAPQAPWDGPPMANWTGNPQSPTDYINNPYGANPPIEAPFNTTGPGSIPREDAPGNTFDPNSTIPTSYQGYASQRPKSKKNWKDGLLGNPDFDIAAVNTATGLINKFVNDPKAMRENQKQFAIDKWMPATGMNRGDYDTNTGRFRPDQNTPVNFAGQPGFRQMGGSYPYGGQYSQGSEVYMDDNEIQQFLANGGELEYIEE